MSDSKKIKLCLIDASGFIHRAYHALPPLTNSKGEPVHAVYGFLRMMAKLLKAEHPDYLAVCFDTPAPTFRHEMDSAYKGTRAELEESLIQQIPLTEELVEAWGLPSLKLDGFEADDLIATLTKMGRQKGWEILILSGDKDVLQLVQDGVVMRDEIRKVDFTAEKVLERFGVMPMQIVDYFSLMGDKVDNVPGIPGVGEKTAAKLLTEFSTIEKIYENLNTAKPGLKEKMLENQERVLKNRTMIRLKDDVPLGKSIEEFKVHAPNRDVLAGFLRRLEFKSDILNGEAPPALKEIKPDLNRVVRVIYTEADLRALVQEFMPVAEFGYDSETDSLKSTNCQVVGLALSKKAGEAFYIPFLHNSLGETHQLSWAQAVPFLRPLFENEKILKIGQNLKFDNAVLKSNGLVPRGPFFDTMVAAYCLDPSRSSFGLKDMAAEFLGERMVRYGEIVGKDQSIAEVPIEQVAPYAAADAEVALRLKYLFQPRLTAEGFEDLFETLEMPLVPVLQSMEEAGIRIDQTALRDIGRKFEERKKGIEKEIFELAGESFLINSSQQLSRILFNKLKLTPLKKTKTGYSTNEDVLVRLASQHPICEKVIAYRELAKLTSTYVDALLELVDQKTGRVHTSFHQTGTATGRLSSSDPNLQNIPIRSDLGREIRRAFGATAGWTLLSADYSQIDLRALAHMSNDPVLVQTFQSGGDVHTATASEIYHVPFEQVTKDMRRNAKAINFGIVYGQQAWGLAQGLGISTDEAQQFIERYFARYAGVKIWIERTIREARKNGFVTTVAGRKRRVDGINADNPSVRGFSERIAINTPIQGTSADIIKAAMIKIYGEIDSRHLKSRMLVQVHDELLFDVPPEELETLKHLVKVSMESAIKLQVPLLVDIKTGPNWNDMEPWKKGRL